MSCWRRFFSAILMEAVKHEYSRPNYHPLCSSAKSSDVQSSPWPESPALGSALGAQAYRNLRPSLGARLGLGQGFARAKRNKAVRHVNS